MLLDEYTFVAASYVFMTILALWIWQFVARALPSPLGGLSWITIFALLCAPSMPDSQGASFAPAIVGMLFGFLNKDQGQVYSNLLPILLTMAAGCIIGFIYQLFKRMAPSSPRA